MNIALIGKMGAGKDSLASILPMQSIAFADELKLLAKNLRINGVSSVFNQATKLIHESMLPTDFLVKLEEFRRIPKTSEKDRELLQQLGQYMRSLDSEVWVN